mgnify:CR=1 FL=1
MLPGVCCKQCKDSERKKNCEEVLGPLTTEAFTDIYQKTKQITDFEAETGEDGGDAEGKMNDLDDFWLV